MAKCAVLCAAALLALSAAYASDDKVASVYFPVVLDAPLIPEKIASGDTAFRQLFRSEKAVRLTEAHSVSYLPQGGKKEVVIVLPAQTLFVLARSPEGEMYCTAKASDAGAIVGALLGAFGPDNHDAGICVRDANHDGTFDEEIVIDQAPYRTRIAYEIINTGKAGWKPAAVATEAVDAAQIPASEISISYRYYSGGLIGKRRGVLRFKLCWPPSMISREASGSSEKECANLLIDSDGEGIEIGAGDGVQSVLRSRSFEIETVMDKDDDITLTVKRAPAGSGLLLVAGRGWLRSNPQFQRTIIEVLSPAARPSSILP